MNHSLCDQNEEGSVAQMQKSGGAQGAHEVVDQKFRGLAHQSVMCG